MVEFQPFPKLPRLFRDCTITEKIDGTNAAVGLGENGEFWAQSRKRLITPDDDNFGFAAWVWSNVGRLQADLGPGVHFGEWWGAGIQRGYGLPKGEKRFSLFNTSRWGDAVFETPGLYSVPVLYRGLFNTEIVRWMIEDLETLGSLAVPGYDRPEGLVVFHEAANQMFKVTVEHDELPKELVTGKGALPA
jgi:hypothetical protein